MRINNGIAYAEAPALTVVGVRPLPGHRLWVRFSTGEEGTFDMTPLLSSAVFAPLTDPGAFASVGLNYGVPTWTEANADLAPEYVYEQTISEVDS